MITRSGMPAQLLVRLGSGTPDRQLTDGLSLWDMVRDAEML